MSKKIVLCADGTWDKDARRSNVYKIFEALVDDDTQIPIYDAGVGADGNIIERLLGGAAGVGLWEKIKIVYRNLADYYSPGDAIYLFGFSRGAFTARSLAGMVAKCGLPTQGDFKAATEAAFDVYRRVRGKESLDPFGMQGVKITMLGVWETVGALGIPSLFGGVDPLLDGFHDTTLHPDVLNAYHAIAIDEHRIEFRPTLWTSPPQPGQVLEQVWFCGAHSDVGGGDPDQVESKPALADITLAWMMGKAAALDLHFEPGVMERYKLPFDPAYATAALDRSWNPGWGIPYWRPVPGTAVLANSVTVRCRNDAAYRPQNLVLDGGVPAASYGPAIVVGVPEEAQPATAGG